VSWNGATEVARWQLLVGGEAERLRAVRAVRKAGFETALIAPAGARYVAVRALARDGRVLATSRTLPLP
jgi:phage replication-related protein YjqB (UPF0714/DUF867 family)